MSPIDGTGWGADSNLAPETLVQLFNLKGTMRSISRTDIMEKVVQRYDQAVMNNVIRAEYVECMIAVALGPEWQFTWQQSSEWAQWDCEHKPSGARIEIKHSAAVQPWTRVSTRAQSVPRFDIAPRTRLWTQNGNKWIDSPGRRADMYVFAWHGLKTGVDQRDPSQWVFLVVAESDLPPEQNSISLNRLTVLAETCGLSELPHTVDQKLRILGTLKKDKQP